MLMQEKTELKANYENNISQYKKQMQDYITGIQQ